MTVDEIAAAADVGRMTVFNHFPRKEDLFFDRDEEAREILRYAVLDREDGVPPVEALRRLVHRRVAERSPYIRFTPPSHAFVETVKRSEALKARARQIRDEVASVVADAMATAVGRDAADSDAHLAAALLLSSWAVAYLEAHRLYRRRPDEAAAQALFLALVDKGHAGLGAALADTPYVAPSARHEAGRST